MNTPFRNIPRSGDNVRQLRGWLEDLGRGSGGQSDTMRHSGGIAGLRAEARPMMADSVGVRRLKITAVATNYLTCNPYDEAGAVDETTELEVAKPPVLRVAGTTRNRTVGSSTVVEEILAPYAVGEDIFAVDCATGVAGAEEDVMLIDMNVDARRWMPQFVEIEGCEEGEDKLRMAVVGTVYDPPA